MDRSRACAPHSRSVHRQRLHRHCGRRSPFRRRKWTVQTSRPMRSRSRSINVERHGLGARVHLVQSDLFQGLAGRRYDLILTNPPYVEAADMATLPDEYRHEPTLALASGKQGLDAILQILAHAPAHLQPGGVLVAEVGNSHVALAERFPEIPFVWLTSASGDESVFLLSAEELIRHAGRFAFAHT